MADKLTLQDCFKYPEAPIIHSRGKLKSVFELIIWAYNLNLSVSFILKDYECKLILRDISELTDEEKQYINDNYIDNLFKDTFNLDNIIWNDYTEIMSICNNKLELIDYLREKNIMVEKEDWFKSGKAVKG